MKRDVSRDALAQMLAVAQQFVVLARSALEIAELALEVERAKLEVAAATMRAASRAGEQHQQHQQHEPTASRERKTAHDCAPGDPGVSGNGAAEGSRVQHIRID